MLKNLLKISIHLILWHFSWSFDGFSQTKNEQAELWTALNAHPQSDSVRVKILNQLCWYNRNNDFVKAIDFGKQAVEIAQKVKDFRGWAESLNFMGVIHRNMGDYNESNSYFFEALNLAEKHQIKLQAAYANNNIGDALKLQKKYTEALPYAEKALRQFLALQDKPGAGYAYIRLGEIYQNLKEYDKSLANLQESLKIRTQLSDNSNLITTYTRIGTVYKLKNELDISLDYFLQALKISEERDDKRAIAGCYDFIASVYLSKKDFDTAEKYALLSLSLAQSIQARVDERNAYRTLAELLELKGYHSKALHYHKKFLNINELIEGLEKASQLAKMQAIYETQKKHKENILLKKENETHERDAELKNLILILVSILFAFALGAIYFVYQSRRKQIKFNAVIEAQNQEISRKKQKLEKNIQVLLDLSRDEAITNGDWRTIGEKVAKSVVKAIEADLAQLWYYNYKEKVFYCVGHHTQDEALYPFELMLSAEKYPYFLEVLLPDSPVIVDDIAKDKIIDEYTKKYFVQRYIQAFILHPVILSENQKGILLTSHRLPRTWELEDFTFLKSMDDEINLAYQGFRRKQAQEKIERQSLEIAKKNESLKTTLKLVKDEQKRTDELLLNILPMETAEELKATGYSKPKHYKLVTVLFTDFKGFTQISENLEPQEVIEELNQCFLAFDEICEKHHLEKIKTIGDSYMCAGGIPVANTSNPIDCVQAGLEMQTWMANWKAEKEAKGELAWELRLGIHSGAVVAGVIGKNKFAYDVWGDTVNTASRMESSGEVGKVNISGATYELVKDQFQCAYRGKIEAKNKGEVEMYFVEESRL
jgi:class 3 adenylate cyclase/tetratricopeptide (TPR) repeat protein